jgi:ADP-ribosylglycohydrolase/predicted enzyme related to lactoylglutathione lyase
LQDDTARAAYFAAGANGVAMRALPHVIWNASGGSQVSLSNDTFRDGILTHGHPRALLGAAVFAHAALLLVRLQGVLDYGDLIQRTIDAETHWAQRVFASRVDWVSAYESSGASIAADWQQTVLEVRDLLAIAQAGLAKGALVDDREVLASLGCFGKFKGAGTTTAVAAIYLASRYAAQPTGGVLAAGFAEGADTDTLAAMTAGLLGLLHGRTWMPSEWLDVQDAQALEHLAERLVENTVSGSWRRFDEREVTRFLTSLEPGRVVSVDGDLIGKVVNVAHAEHRGAVAAKMWKLALQDGQTLHVKEYVTKPTKARALESVDAAVLPERVEAVRRSKAKLRGVMLPAREPERLARFYSSLLGATAKKGVEGRLCVGQIEIVPAGRGNLDKVKDPLRPALVFEAGDLDAIAEQVLSMGGTESERAGDASDYQWARFLDPEGNAFEVVEVQPRRR